MAAPKPMVKPDSIESLNKQQITVILPQASEEYGPISHYYLVVVPHDFATKEPDKYSIEELSSTQSDRIGSGLTLRPNGCVEPFLTHSLSETDRNITVSLIGRLIKGVSYHIFIRAL